MTFVAQRESEHKGKTTEEILEEYASGASMRKLISPQDVADMAVFLASEDARYMTGNTLFVDGGGHINGVSWAPELP